MASPCVNPYLGAIEPKYLCTIKHLTLTDFFLFLCSLIASLVLAQDSVKCVLSESEAPFTSAGPVVSPFVNPYLGAIQPVVSMYLSAPCSP